MARGRARNAAGPAEPKVSESGDEAVIDAAFAPGRGRVGFEDSDGEGSLDEQAVYDLSDDESEDESGSEDTDGDEEPDLDEEIERGGRMGRLARQAKFLEERLKLQQREDEGEGASSGGEEEEAAARERLWGASRGAYYGGDDAEAASDEEALREEEEEAARLQAARAARLDDDDYGLGPEPEAGALGALFGAQRLSQKFGADLSEQLRAARGGDDDLPARAPLAERRARYDAVAARRAAAEGGDEEVEDGYDYEAGRKRRGREEDDFYAAAAAARAATKADKRRRHEAPALAPPLPDPLAEGQRPISREIQKNRGLTPHRRKDLKNPRKKHRIKFAAATVRRKGQVQGVREAPEGAYAGEATGVKARVSKSRRLG